MTRRLLSKKQLAEKIGRSVRHLERLISIGEGPTLIRVGVRAVAIDEDDGDAWIESRRVPAPQKTQRASTQLRDRI